MRPNGEWGYSTRRHMLEPERPEAVWPDRALCLPTLCHFLIVNKILSLSLNVEGSDYDSSSPFHLIFSRKSSNADRVWCVCVCVCVCAYRVWCVREREREREKERLFKCVLECARVGMRLNPKP